MPGATRQSRARGRRHAEAAHTPWALGFRMPAEWERHEATWVAWPQNRTDWPGKLAAVQWAYGELVRKIVPGERVRILVNSPAHEARARRVLARAGVGFSGIEFFRFRTNRSWTRDYGPLFVTRSGAKADSAIVGFRFSGWARYPDWELDALVPERASRALGLRLFRPGINGRPVVLEGGSVDGNGRGTMLTTEECLLDQSMQVRNPGLSRRDMDRLLHDNLGATNVLWLGRGIEGDDTHGHIDDLCRFVGPRTVVLCREDDPRDVNYRRLHENRERLEGMRLEDGSKIEILPLPMPHPLFLDGQRLPASYANFYIANAAVLVPTFNDPRDRLALGILAELISDRPVIGIHAVDLVWGLGTLHCLTREQPAR